LQRHDQAALLHGYETGIIMRSADGEYSERHLPLPETVAYTLTARDLDEPEGPQADVDANGVAALGGAGRRVRARLSALMFADNIQKPTRAELEEAHHHAGFDGHSHGELNGHHGHELNGHAELNGHRTETNGRANLDDNSTKP